MLINKRIVNSMNSLFQTSLIYVIILIINQSYFTTSALKSIHNSIVEQLHVPYTIIQCDKLIGLFEFDRNGLNVIPFGEYNDSR